MMVCEIVTSYLKQNGFSGLFCDSCGCRVDDISACECLDASCEAGYEHKNKKTCPPDCKMNCFEHDDMGGSFFCACPVYKPEVKEISMGKNVKCLKCNQTFIVAVIRITGEAEYIDCPHCKSSFDVQAYLLANPVLIVGNK